MSHSLALLDRWLARLDRKTEVDLAQHGDEIIPELLRVYSVDGFELRLLDGSWLRADEGDVVIELTAELAPVAGVADRGGVVQRRIDTRARRADHLKLELPPAAQGQGRGRTMLRRSTDLYGDLSIEQVRLLAVDAGRYVWAAAGFAFADDDARGDIIDAVEESAELLGLRLAGLDRDTCEPWDIAFLPSVEDVTLGEALAALAPTLLEESGQRVDDLAQPLDRPGKLLLLAEQTPGWRGGLDLRPYDANRGLDVLYDYTD